MTEVVHTTGRPMTRALQTALGDLTGDTRRRVIEALEASDSPTLGALHQAVALELRLCELRETALLSRLDLERSAGIEEPDLPVAEGLPWFPDEAA